SPARASRPTAAQRNVRFSSASTFMRARGQGGAPIDVPTLAVVANNLTPVNVLITAATTQEAITRAHAVAEVQRIVHSGAGGSFDLYFDERPTERVTVPFDASAAALAGLLESLSLVGHVQVNEDAGRPFGWEVTFLTEAGEPAQMPQLRADDTALLPGGLIGS